MKHPTGSCSAYITLMLIGLLLGCGGEERGGGDEPMGPAAGSVSSVTISPANPQVLIDETVQLTATVRDAQSKVLTKSIDWSSGNTSVATISNTGLVRGVGLGSAPIHASVEGVADTASLLVETLVAEVVITSGPANLRQGDAVTYTAEARDAQGAVMQGEAITFRVAPAAAGVVIPGGRLVPYESGAAQLIASAKGREDTLDVTIAARGLSGSFSVVGQGQQLTRYTSDLWLYGNYAYVGTWSCRNGVCGNRLLAWDISNPASPVLFPNKTIGSCNFLHIENLSTGFQP